MPSARTLKYRNTHTHTHAHIHKMRELNRMSWVPFYQGILSSDIHPRRQSTWESPMTRANPMQNQLAHVSRSVTSNMQSGSADVRMDWMILIRLEPVKVVGPVELVGPVLLVVEPGWK